MYEQTNELLIAKFFNTISVFLGPWSLFGSSFGTGCDANIRCALASGIIYCTVAYICTYMSGELCKYMYKFFLLYRFYIYEIISNTHRHIVVDFD